MNGWSGLCSAQWRSSHGMSWPVIWKAATVLGSKVGSIPRAWSTSGQPLHRAERSEERLVDLVVVAGDEPVDARLEQRPQHRVERVVDLHEGQTGAPVGPVDQLMPALRARPQRLADRLVAGVLVGP